MKKRYISIIIIIIIIVISSFVMINMKINSENEELPNLTITMDKTTIPVLVGPYNWGNGKTVKSNEEFDSFAKVLTKVGKTVVVSSSSELKIDFQSRPDSIKLSGNISKEDAVVDNTIIRVPSKKGTWIYFLEGKWKKGTCTYIFAIEVK